MDDGRPIGMKSGPQREDMAKCELGGGGMVLKGALHQSKILLMLIPQLVSELGL